MDYSSHLIVFPGKRPSHFLRKALAVHAGGSIIPPVILSVDEFVDMLYAKDVDAPGLKLEAIDAVAILYRIHCAALRPLGGERFLDPERFFSFGLTLFRDLEDLRIEGIEPAQVRDIDSLTGEIVPHTSREQLQSLSAFYERFYAMVEQHRYSTRSQRYRHAAERFDPKWVSGFRTIVVAGFHALTTAERELFRKIGEDGRSIFVFHHGRGLNDLLRQMHVECVEPPEDAHEPKITLYRSPDTHGQILALGKVLADMKANRAALDERTAVVLPAPDALFPLVRVGLSALGEEDCNVSLGYPLLRTPLFTFVRTLMEVINSMDGGMVHVPAYLRFVLHPYTKNIYGELSSEGTRVMFHTIEEKLRALKTRTFWGLDEIEGDEDLLRTIAERVSSDSRACSVDAVREHLRDVHRHTIERLVSFSDIRDFCGKMRDVLTYIYDKSTARLHPFFYPYSVAFVRALDVLSRSLLSPLSLSDQSAYFLLLKRYLATCHVPFEGTPLRGLQVLGFLETRSLKFERLFVLDVNEGILPDTRREDTVLPNRGRELLGLPTYRDRDLLVSHYFETLLKGAREVHLFYVESDKKERSRFIEKLLWEREKKRGSRNEHDPARQITYRINLVQREQEDVAKTQEVAEFLNAFTYTATSLDSYLACPLRFYYRYVVSLKEKDEVSGDIERPDIGKAVHAAVGRFFSSRLGRRLRPGDLSVQEIGRAVDWVFEQRYGPDVRGATFLLKHQVKAHLEDLVIRYYAPLVAGTGLTVLAVERAISTRKGKYTLSGRPDCIEQRGAGIVVIDYKTTGRPEGFHIRHGRLDPCRRDTWAEAIGSFQLPLYLLLLRESTGQPIEGLNGMFLLLGRAVIDNKIELPLFREGDDRQPLFDALMTVMFRLIDEIADPTVPFSATRDKKRACPFCSYSALCGTQWVVR